MSRDGQSFLDDILEAVRRARSYVTGLDQTGLVSHQMAFDAVLRNLEIIGEAAKRIPPDVHLKIPQIHLHSGKIPQSNGTVLTGRGDRFVVGTDGDFPNS